MPAASMKQLLESGVHFGHQTRRWNPKMKPYIFTERGGIHIIDLQQTTVLLDTAYEFIRNVAGRGGIVLFVGTKKQCQDVIKEEAERVDMPYVSHRWLGGLLTNFATIENRIKRMHELRKLQEEDQLALLPTKERMSMESELAKLEVNLGGVGNMTRLPDAVFIADPKREAIATKEVNKLGIPLVGLVDTNCDPDEVDYLIPGNDDAIRSCSLIVKTLARAVEEGRQQVQVAEFVAAEEAAEEQAKAPVAQAPEQAAPTAAPSRVARVSRQSGPGGRGGRPGQGSRGRSDDRRSAGPGGRSTTARAPRRPQADGVPAKEAPAEKAAPEKKTAAAAESAAKEAPAEKTPVDTAVAEQAVVETAPAETQAEAPAEAPAVEAATEAPAVEAAPAEPVAEQAPAETEAEAKTDAAEEAAPAGEETES